MHGVHLRCLAAGNLLPINFHHAAMTRNHPQPIAIAEGKIGEVKGARAFVTWRRDEAYYVGSQWKGRWMTAGGGGRISV